ncbi:MAG: hypothetical protein E7609_06865 [Ruminococcaceae bacterium]|nr:hypothetical protein [Oscillospiraceae bacterium]
MKKMMIALGSLLVAAFALLIGISVYKNQPENVAIRAITGSLEQLTEREEIAFAYNTLREGSIAFSVKEWVDEDGDDALEGGSVSGTLHFSDSALMLKDFYLNLYDTRLDGDLYLSDELLYVKENEILDGAYGVSFSELAHDFAHSVFAYDANSDYSFPKRWSDMITGYEHEGNGEMAKDAEALAEDLFSELWKAFCENVPFTSQIDEVRLDGEKVKARVIHIEITGDHLADFLEDMLTVLEEHEGLEKFIDTYEEDLKDLFSAYGLQEYESFREIYDEFIEELTEEIEDFCKEEKSHFEPITIKIATPKRSSDLLLLRIDCDGETALLLDCGKDGLAKSDKIIVEIYGESVVYEIDKNDDEDFNLSVECDGEKIFSLDIDKEKGRFSVSVGETNDCYILEGTFEQRGTTTTLTVKEFTEKYYSYYYETTREYSYETNTVITIKQKDKMPSAPKDFDSIDSITEEDLEAWVDKLEHLY